MHLFEEILSEANLLNELRDGNDDRIIAAINGVYRARIVYNDGTKGKKGKNERYILPIAYGTHKKTGNKVVRAYETMGSSKRGLTSPPNDREFPKWKMFRLDRIVSWSNAKRSFKDKLETLKSEGLNMEGVDESMDKLFAISPLCGKSSIPISNSHEMPIKDTPVTVSDVQPEKYPSKAEKTVDFSQENPQITSKEAPDSVPVSKSQVQPDLQPQPTNDDAYKMTANSEPVTKSDIENGGVENNTEENPFDKSIDLLNRMDNLGHDEDEDEEEKTEENNNEEEKV